MKGAGEHGHCLWELRLWVVIVIVLLQKGPFGYTLQIERLLVDVVVTIRACWLYVHTRKFDSASPQH
jgi:hypothetical protein